MERLDLVLEMASENLLQAVVQVLDYPFQQPKNPDDSLSSNVVANVTQLRYQGHKIAHQTSRRRGLYSFFSRCSDPAYQALGAWDNSLPSWVYNCEHRLRSTKVPRLRPHGKSYNHGSTKLWKRHQVRW